MIYWQGELSSPLDSVPDGVTLLYGLVLNPMTDRTEAQRLVAVCESRAELRAAWDAEKVDPYKDENWHRVHRKGGPLEWYNAPFGSSDVAEDYGNGIIELRRDGWRRAA